MPEKRIVAVFTGNRAEYGLQYPILRAIAAHPDLDYRLLVSGAHLDPDFGSSINEILDDGFEIHAKINIEMGKVESVATAQAIGSGIISISHELSEIRPDFLIVYADRFEGLAAVIASTQMNIPTVHVEGGDLTEGGALDDSVRHAMTKLSHLHMTTNEDAAKRILCMGEEPWRVKVVGLPTLDLIRGGDYASENELVENFCLDLDKPILVFTQHSVTTEFQKAGFQIQQSLDALDRFLAMGVQCILTFPNNDTGSIEITSALKSFYANHKKKRNQTIFLMKTLGRFRYHGLLALAKNNSVRIACVGNSSSGIKEAGLFNCPTLNIGTRQNGRLRGKSVLDCDYEKDEIIMGIERCLFDDDFRDQCRDVQSPYGTGNAGEKIANYLAEIALDQKLIVKKMTIKTDI